MFVRIKRSGDYEYLQVVHNERLGGRVQQRVIATLGRLDVLRKTGQLDALLASCARFAEHSAVLSAQRQGRVAAAAKVRIGPPLVFQRLWEQLGLPQVLRRLLAERHFGFDVERAIFLTVLHRLFASGSDRAADVWPKRCLPGPRAPVHRCRLRRATVVGKPQASLRLRPPLRGTDMPSPDPDLFTLGTGVLRHHIDLL
jgi:hypothetical protein